MKQIANISIELWPSNATAGFDLDHDLDIFKVKHGICYISAKNGPITTKLKTNISIELKASNVTWGLTLAMTLTLNFQGYPQNAGILVFLVVVLFYFQTKFG